MKGQVDDSVGEVGEKVDHEPRMHMIADLGISTNAVSSCMFLASGRREGTIFHFSHPLFICPLLLHQ